MEKVNVLIPQTSHFSIGTSPYYAHQHGLAIDIYHEISLDNYEALSPVSGKVIKTKTLVAPKSNFEGGINKEHLTLIENKENPKFVYKFLHIKPSIKKGQDIEVGDAIGKTIRNGYFAPWSSPHLHLEVRSKEDAIRASGGNQFSLHFNNINQRKKNTEEHHNNKIPIAIKYIFKEYLLAYFPENLYYKIDPYIGVKGKNLESDCILDGGIPIYKKGIAIFDDYFKSEYQSSIHLNGKKIGTLWDQRGNFGFIKFDQVRFYLNDKEIRGISLFLANFKPLIKIVPFNMKDHPYEINSTQNLSLASAP
jgi:hypothetical protein